MKDFNDFRKDEDNARGEAGAPKDVAEQFSALANEYEGKSADEIMKAILKEAERGRKNGTLTDADIDSFSEMISPMLTDAQRKTLDKVVRRLKSK